MVNTKSKSLAIRQLQIEHTSEWIYIKSAQKWHALSSAVLGAGFQTHQTFINRHVDKNYTSDDPIEECHTYLKEKGITSRALAMMTAAKLEDAVIVHSKKAAPPLLVMVSSGTANAVDASRAHEMKWIPTVDTINIWVFVDGTLSNEAYIQSIVTVTEAKTKALYDENIRDQVTSTIATGTSTDSVMIAATQTGEKYAYGGTITPVGKEMARLVYEGLRLSIQRYKKRKRLTNE